MTKDTTDFKICNQLQLTEKVCFIVGKQKGLLQTTEGAFCKSILMEALSANAEYITEQITEFWILTFCSGSDKWKLSQKLAQKLLLEVH